MIKFYHQTIKDQKLNILKDFKIGSWIYVENPNDAEIEQLAETFFLEAGHVKDAVDPLEVPRLEIEKEGAYIFTRVPYVKNNRVSTIPVLVAIGANFLITASKIELPFLKKFTDGKINFTTTQKTKLFLQIFSEITSAYNIFLHNISREVRGISVQMEKINNKDIVQFVTFENVLNDFLAALVPTNAILNNLLHGKYLDLYEEDKDLIEDLFLNNNQLIELCKGNLKTIVNIRESYSTIMTNNLNRVIKFLTASTVILTVPMIISSFYGMNIALPFAQSPWAFWIVLGTTLALALILLGIFIKKKWL